MGYSLQEREAAQVARENRRNTVVAAYLRGASYRTIAQAVGVSHVTVKRDLDAMRAEWAECRIQDFEAARDDIRHRLLLVYQLAAQEWAKSKQKRRRNRTGERSKSGGSGGGSEETWSEETQEERIGDPRFLERMESAADKLARLDGCYKPTQIQGLLGIQTTIDWQKLAEPVPRYDVVEMEEAKEKQKRLGPAGGNGESEKERNDGSDG